MPYLEPHLIKTISDYHNFMGLPKAKHPLISVLRFEDIKLKEEGRLRNIVTNFYCIALKKNFNSKMQYGQQIYDFDDGVLAFVAPNQVIKFTPPADAVATTHTGWLLIFHPDFLWNTALATAIKHYDFFGYQLNEALHLSEKEEKTLSNLIDNIYDEYNQGVDKYTQEVIVTQIQLLLTFSERFYQRQFITRKKSSNTILIKIEELLKGYFEGDNSSINGLPTVQFISGQLNISPNYLSRLLKSLTGQSTKHFIQDIVIEFAKEKLSTTNLTINEISYKIGFEHPQSFFKLFKAKTNLTPLEFRASFN